MSDATPSVRHAGEKPRLLTFWSIGWVLLLAALVSAYATWWILSHRRPVIGDGRNVASYGFDLSTLLIPREQLVAGGMPKDGLRARTNPPMLTVAEAETPAPGEHGRPVKEHELVIGLELHGDARAYPLSFMALHEIVNDTVGGMPVAVTYNPLSDGIVVVERTVGGRVREFGVSGLLYQSNLVMYDRQPGGQGESLWSQLGLRAIAGPAAREGLTLKPVLCQRVRWGDWKGQHPATRVLSRDPALLSEYGAQRYATYLQSDELRFPVSPEWRGEALRKKSPITAVRVAGQWHVFALDHLRSLSDQDLRRALELEGVALHYRADTLQVNPAPGTDVATVHAFWFAWYAFHPAPPF